MRPRFFNRGDRAQQLLMALPLEMSFNEAAVLQPRRRRHSQVSIFQRLPASRASGCHGAALALSVGNQQEVRITQFPSDL